MLSKPYTLRVAGTLLLKLYFEKKNILKHPILNYVLLELNNVKDIDVERILQIIFQESASQSIRSTSGDSYESRFKKLAIAQNFKYQGQTYDSKIKAVEYDAVLKIDNIQIGVSIKRTLRERYKQNHEDVDQLMVDMMLVVTLGIDLNENKINYITAKKGNYIIVASDIYETKEYMKNHPKVFPAKELNQEKIKRIYHQMTS